MSENTNMTKAQLEAELAKYKAENEALKNAKDKPRNLTLKVSEKGAVSLYGMGKWPVTLYAEQWARVFEAKAQVEAFIEENKAKLSVKAKTQATPQDPMAGLTDAERAQAIAEFKAKKVA